MLEWTWLQTYPKHLYWHAWMAWMTTCTMYHASTSAFPLSLILFGQWESQETHFAKGGERPTAGGGADADGRVVATVTAVALHALPVWTLGTRRKSGSLTASAIGPPIPYAQHGMAVSYLITIIRLRRVDAVYFLTYGTRIVRVKCKRKHLHIPYVHTSLSSFSQADW